MRTGTRVKYSGRLKQHWDWSVYLACTLLVLTVVVFAIDRKAGVVTAAFTAAYLISIAFIYAHSRRDILPALVEFASRYSQAEQQLLKQMEIPLAIVDVTGHTAWMNEAMCALSHRSEKYRGEISNVFPYLSTAVFPETTWEKDVDLEYEEKKFRAHIQRVVLDELIEKSDLVEKETDEDGESVSSYFYAIYMLDETELRNLRQENHEQKNVVGLVYMDNYEEAMDNVDEVHASLLNVLVDRQINKYFSARNCLARKLEKDKYLVVMNQKSLEELERDHFSVLEEVKTINIGNDTVMTVSIGIGLGGKDYVQNHDFARNAIELALGRGGDQTVVNNEAKMTFFGGKSQSNERNTRVKARVKAQAMREIIETRDRVIAMGHRIADMDSLGACVGIYRAAKTLGKEAHIVLGDDRTAIAWWTDALQKSGDYEEDMFLSHEQAIDLTDNSAVVVVVDTNQPSRVECKELLERTNSIVVLDHHRQTTDQIQNASLSYIEPSASSACEMVSEVLQYFEENVRLRNLEADCMYAGIIIDTNSFNAKTGARTFEAAAYLRRSGADVIRVRKALREDMNSYKARAEAVRHAVSFMGKYAISILPDKGLESANVIGAQAANELLDIRDVKASFVVTQYKGKAFISARALDEVNVQVIMERLGGGGHMNIAGAQIDGATNTEAVEILKDLLMKMTEEGDL